MRAATLDDLDVSQGPSTTGAFRAPMFGDVQPQSSDLAVMHVSLFVILDHWVDVIYATLRTAVVNESILANRLVPVEVCYHATLPIDSHPLVG